MRPLRSGILAMAAAAPGPKSMQFLGARDDLSPAQVMTVNNVNIGTPGNRVVVISTYNWNGAVPSSVTINGVAATIITQFVAGFQIRATICYAYVPSGSSVTVVFSFSTAPTMASWAVYALYNLDSNVAYATQQTTTTGSPIVATVNAAANGFAFGALFTSDNGVISQTGLTLDHGFSAQAGGWQVVFSSAPTPSAGILTWQGVISSTPAGTTAVVMASFA